MSNHSNDISKETFTAVFGEVLSESAITSLLTEYRQSPAGVAPRVPGHLIIMGMVFHYLLPSGHLAAHVRQLTGHRIRGSSISERRETMGCALFQSLLKEALGPIAQPTTHPQAFYKGLRLVGMDGTTWSVSNTPPVKASVRKVRSRRGASAFYKVGMTALYELGTHNPLAANIGKDKESEMVLAIPLLSALQSDWLLLADRYYGAAKFVSRLLALPSKPSFLVRARDNLTSKIITRFRDGSCLIEIRDVSTGKFVQLREIRARVRCRSGQWVKVRLWTNLLNPDTHPAVDLVRLYGMRWEQETAYQQIKLHLRRTPLLLSHTLTTAVQEVGCLVLAQTIIARMRVTAAGKEQPPLQISFIQTLHHCRSFWVITSAAFSDLLPAELAPLLFQRVLDLLRQQASPPRRARSCPRALRQPVSSWPRLRKNVSSKGAFEYKISRPFA
jgi:hypothetical protein